MECGRNGNSANKNVDVLMGRRDEKTTAAGRRKGEKGRLAKREERGIVWEMRRLKGQSRERTWTVRVREQLACEGETGSQAQVSSAGGERRESLSGLVCCRGLSLRGPLSLMHHAALSKLELAPFLHSATPFDLQNTRIASDRLAIRPLAAKRGSRTAVVDMYILTVFSTGCL